MLLIDFQLWLGADEISVTAIGNRSSFEGRVSTAPVTWVEVVVGCWASLLYYVLSTRSSAG